MSDDPPLSVASARPCSVENAQPAGLADELLDLAAAIKWVEGQVGGGVWAGVMASKASAGDGLAAVERIQDITVALRECAVDAALCDSLEAAARDVADVISRNEAAAERAQSASKLLGVLADRIGAMIENAGQAAGEGAPAAPPPAAVVQAAPADAARDADRDSTPSDSDAAHIDAAPSDAAPSDAALSDAAQGDAARRSGMPPFAANDPLATLRTLSAEELIALFS
jgi:hypothetical protein